MKKFRQFKNKEPKQEQKSKAGVYISIFLAVIMIGGVAGIFLSNPSSDSQFSYGKYDFKNVNGIWITKISGKEKAFYYLPEQIINLNVSDAAVQIIKNSQGVLISFDPELNETSKAQAVDIFKFELVDALITSNKQAGFGISKKINSTLPYVTCENSSAYVPVMSLSYGDETDIKLINTCILVSARDEYALLSLLDYLKYKIYGVLE